MFVYNDNIKTQNDYNQLIQTGSIKEGLQVKCVKAGTLVYTARNMPNCVLHTKDTLYKKEGEA